MQATGELLLIHRLDAPHSTRENRWVSRVSWLAFDLAVFAVVVMIFG